MLRDEWSGLGASSCGEFAKPCDGKHVAVRRFLRRGFSRLADARKLWRPADRRVDLRMGTISFSANGGRIRQSLPACGIRGGGVMDGSGGARLSAPEFRR